MDKDTNFFSKASPKWYRIRIIWYYRLLITCCLCDDVYIIYIKSFLMQLYTYFSLIFCIDARLGSKEIHFFLQLNLLYIHHNIAFVERKERNLNRSHHKVSFFIFWIFYEWRMNELVKFFQIRFAISLLESWDSKALSVVVKTDKTSRIV